MNPLLSRILSQNPALFLVAEFARKLFGRGLDFATLRAASLGRAQAEVQAASDIQSSGRIPEDVELQITNRGRRRAGLPLLSALPLPVPPPGSAPPVGIPGQPPPFGGFPAGQAANDAIFRERLFGRLAGRLAGPVGVLVTAAELIILAKQERDERRRREEEQLDKDIEERRVRVEREAEIFRRVPRLPGRLPQPIPEIPATLPQEIPVPSAPAIPRRPVFQPSEVEFPDIQIAVPVPEVLPGQVAIPSPSAEPAPVIGPGGFETAQIGTRPVPSSLIFPFGLSSLLVSDFPLPTPASSPGLTGSEPGTVPSGELNIRQFPITQASLQQQTQCRPRRCDDELDEPRTRCYKGLYRESLLDTDFTQWTEIDCLTGREIGDRPDNVIDFPDQELRRIPL